MARYHQLRDDMTSPARWHLGEILSADGDEPLLDDGQVCEKGALVAEVTHPGPVLSFSLTSFNTPIVSGPLARAIGPIAGMDVQCLPVVIAGQSGFQVMNVVRVVDCLDEEHSEFLKWTERDHRPDLVGRYKQVVNLRLDRSRIPADANFFRVARWTVALIVSDAVRKAMENVGCDGAKFIPVA